MATIVTVHGTFAHAGSTAQPAEGTASELQWWQTGSKFQQDCRDLLEAKSGELEVASFEWSGDNSELGRREAGSKLLEFLRTLEAKKEPYCIVGHSHGGSVVSSALLASAAQNNPLKGLSRWITVGTPFVKLKKEPLLFTRLNLLSKVIFVASMMLFLMFLVYLVANVASGEGLLFGGVFPGILVVTGAMMSLPAIVFYAVLRYLDGRRLLLYRRRVTERARESFGARWLSLAHSDDEAIQGLAFLPGAKLFFFDKSFAVSTFTALSVVALPLLYFIVLISPPAMVGIADWLNTEIYAARSSPEAEAAVSTLHKQLREARQRASARPPRSAGGGPASVEDRRAVWRDYAAKRRELEEQYGDISGAERALRFSQRFFEDDGEPCGMLCGGGSDLRVNSGLLLHVVTDELSWSLGGESSGAWRGRFVSSLLLPAILVPLISGLIALALMVAIRGLAIVVSSASSYVLNQLTNAEVKRAAFGNDTEGETAIGAIDRPVWLMRSPPRLPAPVGDLITTFSNGVATQSLAKFRRAIGQLAMAEPKHTADSAITTYFTWKELVHASYFDVPEFRKLIAQAVSRADGFAPSGRFMADPDFARTAEWLAEIEATPGSTAHTDAGKAGPQDAAAVSAVVASTVKAQP